MRRGLVLLLVLGGLVALGASLTTAPSVTQVTQGQDTPFEVHASSVVHISAGRAVNLQNFAVINCGPTATTFLTANPARKLLILQNQGGTTVYIGSHHVTVTASNGLALHGAASATAPASTARLVLESFTGQVACIGDTAAQALTVIELVGSSAQ